MPVLDLIDYIAASNFSLEELDLMSAASSAQPNRTGEEWRNHVTSSQDTQTWWTSFKPGPLHYTTSDPFLSL